MIILDQEKVTKQFKKFGFKSVNVNVVNELNIVILKFVEKNLKKKAHSGGRIVLPLEYFGVDSHHYHDSQGQFTNMAVTDNFIRPPMSAHEGGGGAKKPCAFLISKADTKLFVVEATRGKPFDAKVVSFLQEKVNSALTEYLNVLKTESGGDEGKTVVDLALFSKVLRKRSVVLLKK